MLFFGDPVQCTPVTIQDGRIWRETGHLDFELEGFRGRGLELKVQNAHTASQLIQATLRRLMRTEMVKN